MIKFPHGLDQSASSLFQIIHCWSFSDVGYSHLDSENLCAGIAKSGKWTGSSVGIGATGYSFNLIKLT